MSAVEIQTVAIQTAAPTKAIRRVRLGPGICIATAFVILLAICAVVPDLIAPHSPNEQHLRDSLLPPAWHEKGTWTYPFGTDTLGRDVFSRLVYGTRTSLAIATFAVALSSVIGVSLGLIAGYFGGKLDRIVVGWTDVQQGLGGILIIMV